MNECLSGDWHEQRIVFLINYAPYFMRAGCDNPVQNEVFVDGIFEWHETPVNDPDNDPPFCKMATDIQNEPSVVFGDDAAVDDSGMNVSVAWTIYGTSDSEASQDATLRLEYDLHDCATNARCLDLAEVEVTLPSTTVQGVLIEDARLRVYQVDVQPAQQSNGAFAFAPGTIHALMSASANGVPIMLMGANSGTATGLLAPGSDTLTFSGLKFDYSDTIIAAQLQVDMVGDYTERGPTAVIVPVNVPPLCKDPVTFRAASADPDVQSLTHYWWVPGSFVDVGSTIDVVMSSGDHPITLISQDSDGRLDAAAVQYTRTCR